MQYTISVVIPVYNAEKYIEKCLDSVMAQTVPSMEIICVNDGSKDQSLVVLKRYRDNHFPVQGRVFTIIDQSNGGPSAARNTGMDAAHGEFLAFVDSDDFIEPRMYENLITIAERENLNVVLCGILNKYADGSETPTKELVDTDCQISREVILQTICPTLMTEGVYGGPCNRIYRRLFLQEYNIRMPENIGYGEDAVFQMQVFDKLQATWVSGEKFYWYLHREGSQSSAKPGRFFNTLKPLYEIRCQYGEQWKIDKTEIHNYFVYCTIMDLVSSVRTKEYGISYIRKVMSDSALKIAVQASQIEADKYTKKIFIGYCILKLILK